MRQNIGKDIPFRNPFRTLLLPSGLLNAESCRMGAPAFVSFPHFFNGDPWLLSLVDGLHPQEDKHAFLMDILPVWAVRGVG